MKTALTLAAVCALVAPAAALAQANPHGDYHGAGRPAGAANARPAGAPASSYRFNGQGAGRVGRPGYAGNFAYRGQAGRYDRRYDRYGGGAAFGVGVVTGAALAGAYNGGYGGYGYGGYPVYQGGYGYAPDYAPDAGYYGADPGAGGYAPGYADDGSANAYPPGDPAYAGADGAPPPGYGPQDYAQQPGGDQAAPPPAPAYDNGAGYGQGYAAPATGPACGQWVWDAPIGRYVWGC